MKRVCNWRMHLWVVVKLWKFGQKDHLSWYRCTPVTRRPACIEIPSSQSKAIAARRVQFVSSPVFCWKIRFGKECYQATASGVQPHHHLEGANMIHSLQRGPRADRCNCRWETPLNGLINRVPWVKKNLLLGLKKLHLQLVSDEFPQPFIWEPASCLCNKFLVGILFP